MSRAGLKFIWRSFVTNKHVFTPDLLKAYLEPFEPIENRLFIRNLILDALKHHHELEGLAEKLANLKKPTAIIYGENDPLCAAHMRRLSKDLEHATVVPFKDCGHLIQEDCPDELWHEVRKFLRQVTT